MFLATQKIAADVPQEAEELKYHSQLASYIACTSIQSDSAPADTIAVSLVGHQLVGDQKHYLKWFRGFARNRPRHEIAKTLEIVGQNDFSLYSALTGPGRGKFGSARKEMPSYLHQYASAHVEQDSAELPRGQWLPLSRVFRHQSNPVSQENGLLRLAKGLGQLFANIADDATGVTPFSVEVRCDNWELINNPNDTAESHLAVHTWPESGVVTLDVFVCNRGSDNSAAAQQVLQQLCAAFAPAHLHVQQVERRAAMA